MAGVAGPSGRGLPVSVYSAFGVAGLGAGLAADDGGAGVFGVLDSILLGIIYMSIWDGANVATGACR